MAQHFMGAATFSFECRVSSHDFPNFVLCAAGPPCSTCMRSTRVGSFAEIGDEEFSYSFKASLANRGS